MRQAIISFDLFPNPSGNFIEVTLEDDLNSFSYIILDNYGKKLEKGILNVQNKKIDVSKYKPGIYLLTLQFGDQFQAKKFMIH